MAESYENVSGTSNAPISPRDCLIGWICILQNEYYEAKKMFDQTYDTTHIVRGRGDRNSYDVGRIGNHLVVMNCPACGAYGQIQASKIASDMRSTFPAIRFVLLVGIGGASPAKKDVRLGDVVLGTNVLPYMQGKQTDTGIVITGRPGVPPTNLRTSITRLVGELREGPSLERKIEMMGSNAIPRPPRDNLYKASYMHSKDCDCLLDDPKAFSQFHPRPDRGKDLVRMHQGVVGSADQVMKNASFRDEYALNYDIICFEMEAIAVMQTTSCITIRGMSDYSDGHKNDDWHSYASLSAAICAKELLKIISPRELADFPMEITPDELERAVKGAMYQVQRSMHQAPGPQNVYQTAERNHDTIVELYSLVQDFMVPKLYDLTNELNEENSQKLKDQLATVEVLQKDLEKGLDSVGSQARREARRRQNSEAMRESWKGLRRKIDNSSRWVTEVSKITHQVLASNASKGHRFFIMVGKRGNRTFQDAGHAIHYSSAQAIEHLKSLMEQFKARFRASRKVSQLPPTAGSEGDDADSDDLSSTGGSRKDDDDDDSDDLPRLPPGNGGPPPTGGGGMGVPVYAFQYGTNPSCSTSSASIPTHTMERSESSPAPARRPPPPPPPARSSTLIDLRTPALSRPPTRRAPPPPPPPAPPMRNYSETPPLLPQINFEHRPSEDSRSSFDTRSLSTSRSFESDRRGLSPQERAPSPLLHSAWRHMAEMGETNSKPMEQSEIHPDQSSDEADHPKLPVSALISRFQGNGLMGYPRVT